MKPRPKRRESLLNHTAPHFWEGQLDERLNEFGASTSDPSEIDPESCKTERLREIAVRVRARYLARRIQASHQRLKGEMADRLFEDLMDRAQLMEVGSALLQIAKKDRRLRAPSSGHN